MFSYVWDVWESLPATMLGLSGAHEHITNKNTNII